MNPSTEHAAAVDEMSFNTNGLPSGAPITSILRGARATAAMLLDEQQTQAIRHLLGDATCIEVAAANNPAIPESLRTSDPPNRPTMGRQSEVVGVRCGAASQNLAAIGFSSPTAFDSFSKDNAKLKNCPVTRWGNWLLLWIRTDFIDKQNIDAGKVLWVCNGIVPLSCFPGGDSIFDVIRPGNPELVPYGDIVWPEGFRAGFRLPYLKFLYGPPVIHNGRKTVLNASLWAGWMIEQLEVAFDPWIGAFKQVRTDEMVGFGVLSDMVVRWLRAAAAQDPKGFPIDEIRPAKVAEIIDFMKLTNPIHTVSEEEGLQEFFQTMIRVQPGANITRQEVWEAYSAFCKSRRVAAYPEIKFRKISLVRIRQIFGKTRCNGIIRGGRAKCGYNGLALAHLNVNPGKADAAGAAFKDVAAQAGDESDSPDPQDFKNGKHPTEPSNFCPIAT